ncbi:MAG: trigger factor [Methylophilaceae bacterium]|nr:trigger factor [Methylophilaceae bacterium]
MSASLETTSKLERRLTVQVPLEPIKEEVAKRVAHLAKTLKVPGFREGKAPASLIQQQRGQQVYDEVFADNIEQSFKDAVAEHKLRVAGLPKIEHNFGGATAEFIEYVATFEIFPEIVIGDLSKTKVERPVVEVSDADVKKTVDVLVRQRATYEAVNRAAKLGDMVSIVLSATLDGEEIESTDGQSIDLVLGEGGRVAEVDNNLLGTEPGSNKSFDITYPADHGSAELAGKTVKYEVTVNTVSEPHFPEIDDEFARSLGVENGSVEKMYADIKESLNQEVAKRVRARIKEQAFLALLASTEVELPQAAITAEIEQHLQKTQDDLANAGANLSEIKLERHMFAEQAERGLKLRLILIELVNKNGLLANTEQIRAAVDQFAQSYEKPEDVVRWYYADKERLTEPATLATEENVVAWVLQHAEQVDKAVDFDNLMGRRS